jgi:hypothetical protein
VPLTCWAFATGKEIVPRRTLNEIIVETLFIAPLSLFASKRTKDCLAPHRKKRAKTHARGGRGKLRGISTA